ncbi:MAG: tyrosine-protein phosphatase [Hyphomicrobiaceae bacterium]
MIDLHSHMLPGIDDGAADLSIALAMARMQIDQGVTIVACTPHILPGVYHNEGPQIRQAVANLQGAIDDAGLNLLLKSGADNHIAPDFVRQLRSGRLLSLGDTRYVLVEPPHNVPPAYLEDLFFGILLADFVPICTHPERLGWVDDKYDLIKRLADRGAWMQITSGSLTGRFGSRPKYWAERMICEGIAKILASDSHNITGRPPDLADGRRAAEGLVGSAEAGQMVEGRPSSILLDKAAMDSAPISLEKFDGTVRTDRDNLRASYGRGARAFHVGLRRYFRH